MLTVSLLWCTVSVSVGLPTLLWLASAVVQCEIAQTSREASLPIQNRNQVLASLQRLEEQHVLLTEHPTGLTV